MKLHHVVKTQQHIAQYLADMRGVVKGYQRTEDLLFKGVLQKLGLVRRGQPVEPEATIVFDYRDTVSESVLGP